MVQAKRDAGGPEKFYIAGRGALEVTIGEYGNQDMARFMSLVLLVILGTLYLTYRSIRGVLLPVAVVIGSVIWTIGLMAAAEVPMMHITSIMPVVLMAVGVADGIHILSCYYDKILEHPEQSKISSTEVVVAAMVEMWKPVVLTSLTTAAGFLSFLTAPMPPVQHFGLFSSFGVLAAMVFSLTLFPAVLSLLPAKMSKMSRGLGRQAGGSGNLAAAGWAAQTLAVLGRGVARHPQLVLLPALLITGCVSGRHSLYAGQ